ncbi:hypothetical protein ACVIIV_001811 [Bradyrhizobium sp. USDA 4354]
MFRSIANTGLRTRLLGGFALICGLLAAIVIYTGSYWSQAYLRGQIPPSG